MTGFESDRPIRLLVGIDGSPAADLAVDFVAGATWPAGSHVVVAEAISVPATISAVTGSTLAFVDFADIEADLRASAQQTVEAASVRLRASGLRADGRVLSGRTATALADEADAFGADLIVVGSRGHGTIEAMLLGSVSAELVDHARAPVLVVRKSSAGRIVLAWDGSPGARAAACLVGTWPLFRRGSVRVVTVTDAGLPWWTGLPEPASPGLVPTFLDAARAARAGDRELAIAMSEELRLVGVEAGPEPLQGDPAEQILAAADALNADLIVMGTRGRTGIPRVVLGSVARNVLGHASCSVLVVRHPAEQGARTSAAFSTPWGDGT